MKTIFKRIGKSSLSIILSVMMIFSTMLVGTISSNAASGTFTVYFKNTVNWSNVYVYFYNAAYWNSSNGSGSSNIVSGPNAMTKVSGTDDMYSYTYTGDYSQYISFTKDSQSNYENFWNTSAVYRTDFSTDTPVYTPSTTSSGTYNGVPYYNNGTWSVYEEPFVIGAAPANVIDESNIMFYIQSYNGTSLALTANSTSNLIAATSLEAGYGYVSVPKTSLSTYTYITNNPYNWVGVNNSNIANATGGELFVGNSTITTNAATTANTTLSKNNLILSTDNSVTFGTTASSTKSAYNSDLYVQYYVNNVLVDTDEYISASTSESTLTYDTTSLTAGEYTVKTVLTDGKVYYVADTDTFTISEVVKHDITFSATPAEGGSISVTSNGSVTTSSPATIAEGDFYTISVIPNPGYEVDTFQIDGVFETLIDNQYSGTMGKSPISVEATFKKTDFAVNYSTMSNGTVSGSNTAQLGDTVNLSVAPAAGYELENLTVKDASNNDVTVTNNSFTMPASSVTVSATFSLKAPVVDLVADKSTIEIGEAATLTPTVTADIEYNGVYTVTKNNEPVSVSDYINNNVFMTPNSSDAAGTYVVTYTATVTSGENQKTASSSVTINVAQSNEQAAYIALTSGLGTETYPDLSSSSDVYTKSSYDAYISAYTNAQAVILDGYPAYNGTANINAKTALDTAKAGLVEKTTLATPVVSVSNNGVLIVGAPVNVTVTNVADYPAGTAFLLKNSEGVTVGTSTDGTFALTYALAAEGNYTVSAVTDDTDNYRNSADSDSFTISKAETVEITLEAVDNATVTAEYTDAYGAKQQLTEGNTATVPVGNQITVSTAVDPGFTFESNTYGDTVLETNPATFTANSVDTTISTAIRSLGFKTYKVAVIAYADPDTHTATDHYLLSKNVTYTSASQGSQTTQMTHDVVEPKVYFYTSNWADSPVKEYQVYDVLLPEDVTSFTVDNSDGDKVTYTISDSVDYYTIYHYGGWNSPSKTIYDRMYKVKATADTSLDSGATASIAGVTAVAGHTPASGLRGTDTYYTFGSVLALSKNVSDAAIYGFDYWSDGTTQFTDDTYTVAENPDNNTTLTAYFRYNASYPVVLVPVDHATISSTDTEAYATKSVTITVTPDEGYKTTGLTVTDANSNPVSVTDNGDGTYTFTMPESAVSVNATVAQKELVTITTTTDGDGNGTVASSAEAVWEGDTVTLTATAGTDGSTFSKWTINGTYTIVSGSLDSAEVTIRPTTNIQATATFKAKTYYLIYGTTTNTDIPLIKTSKDNVYATPITVAHSSSNNDNFTLWDKDENKFLYHTSADNNFWFTSAMKSTSSTAWSSSHGVSFVNNTGAPQYVYYDASSGRLWLDSVLDGYVNIYAKNGTVRNNDLDDKGGIVNAYYTTDLYGVTKVLSGTVGEGTTHQSDGHDAYTTYVAEKGKVINISTTMNSSYRNAGYYVYAYCVNGKTVPATSRGNGVYQASWEVQSDTNYVEITPVYFNTNIEANDDYITFYVDAAQLGNTWGDTVACYTYYSNAVGNNDGDGDGDYPGQPMLLGSDGLYYTRVAKYYYDSTGTKVESSSVKGLTLNSYSWDRVHNTISNDGTYSQPSATNKLNKQTYDYNDFVNLANAGYDTIMYEVQYRTATSNQKTLINNSYSAPSKSGSTINTSTYEGHNGWTDFTDYFRNKTDLLGNFITVDGSGEPVYGSQPLYAVSTGNQDTTVGDWATVWYVYDWNGNYVTQGTPCDFIDETSTAYQALNNSNYIGHPAYITFESEMDATTSVTGNNTDNTGIRVDGRWYYTKSSGLDIKSDVSIEYSTDNGTSYTPDTDTNSENTGFIGQQTGSTANIDGFTTATYSELNVTAELNATSGMGWIFKGWYIKDNNGNYITVDANSPFAEVTISNEYHFVARFVQAGEGSLTLSHSKYGGSDAHGGNGFYYIAATLTHNDGTTEVYPMSSNAISIPTIHSNDTISITIRTVCAGDNTFFAWYEGVDGDYQYVGPEDTDYRGNTGTVEYTWTLDTSMLFDGDTQLVKTLNYYSDIVPVTGECVLTYKYYNRFNQQRDYIVKVTLDDMYIAEHGYVPTNELIYDNAPAIDDLYKDCKWNLTDVTKVSINGSNATIWAEQTIKTYDVTMVYPNEDTDTYQESFTVYLNDYIKNNDGFITAPVQNSLGQQFSYWQVIDTDQNVEVAKCYANDFNLRIVGNYLITAIYGVAVTDSTTISDATYTREQYTSGGTNHDYLYADFVLSYMSVGGILLNSEEAANMNYHTGVVVEISQSTKLNEPDVPGGKVDYSSISFGSTDEQIKTAALSANGSTTRYTYDGDNRMLFNFEADNSLYNNKNRLDFYVRFKNTAAYRQYVMKAYYYVYYTDTNGETVYTASTPVYFNLYEIGNSVQSTDQA